jgi:Kef-type K+ transport system membrane component KefB
MGSHYLPFFVIALVAVVAPLFNELPVRLALLLVSAFVVLAAEMGLDFLIGAFAAGVIVGMFAQGEEAEPFRHKLDGLGFGFVIPIFFVVTGVNFNLQALLGSTRSLLCVPLFLALFLLVRGLPVLLYRRELGGRDRLALAFYSASALPLIVRSRRSRWPRTGCDPTSPPL